MFATWDPKIMEFFIDNGANEYTNDHKTRIRFPRAVGRVDGRAGAGHVESLPTPQRLERRKVLSVNHNALRFKAAIDRRQMAADGSGPAGGRPTRGVERSS